MSKLVIVESPAKAKTIKKYLGSDYEVIASKGHVRDLPAARLNVDTKHDFAPKYQIIKGKEELVKELRDKVSKSDNVFLATDPDREGEAISWHLATILGLDMEDENRVEFNEITQKAVCAGIENPRKIDMDLVNSQQARRILDRIVGYRLSPFISQKIRRGLSAGRVQSVATSLIVDRENEIRAFVPEEFWSIDASFSAKGSKRIFSAAFYGNDEGKIKLTNKEQTDKILSELDGAEYIIEGIKKGTRKKSPPAPYMTSTLQQDAAHRLNYQARRTMKVAQELYEGVDIKGIGTVGLITYMRTDSLRISQEARQTAEEYIRGTFGDKYVPSKPNIYKSKNNSQDGHEAIRPTMPNLTPAEIKDSLTAEQYSLYKLIWETFIASVMSPCQQETTQVDIKANGYLFKASGYTIKFDGFTAIYDKKRDDVLGEGKAILPAMNEGDALHLKNIEGNQHFTQPPVRYTEATLIKALEEDGIGRPSTYATIISAITGREYVEREGKQLKPTELGEVSTGLLKDKFSKIVNTKFTAQMEADLDKVQSGEVDYIKLLHTFYDDFEKNLAKVKTEMEGVKLKLKEEETDVVCEKCGRNMVVKVSKTGKFLACPGYPECRNTKPIIQTAKGTCPVCGSNIVLKKTRRGRVFYGCAGYPSCNFMTWDEPQAENCPTCGKTLFKKRNTLYCAGEGCGYEKVMEAKKRGRKAANSTEE